MQSSTKVMVVCLKDIILSTGKFIPKDYREILTLAETLLLCQDLGDEIMKEHFQLYSKNPDVKNGWHKMTYKPKKSREMKEILNLGNEENNHD